MTWGWAVVLCLLVGAVHAGELSDHLVCGDSKALKHGGFSGVGHTETLRAQVGAVDEKIPCLVSGDKAGDSFEVKLSKQPDKVCALQITEVYPPDAPGVRYTYDVFADGKLVYIRDHPGLMFGRASYFIYLEGVHSSGVQLRFVNKRNEPFRIADIWLYSDFPAYCESAGFETPYYLAPLLTKKSQDREQEARYLKTHIRPTGNPDVKLACVEEHHYMIRDASFARQQFEALLRLSKRYDMPAALHFVSWWGGTPGRIPDGKGGAFRDVEYQQVCWSETDTHDEGEELKKLLGDKWDIRYGLSTPNQWSNCPWLTMNHPRLNSARHKAIGEKLGILADVLGSPEFNQQSLLAIGMENEPRYWDLNCPDGKYPVERKNLWADFNPVTVAAAAKDGVTLDPSDGLDFRERLWLHENVARYQQETYDAHARALKKLKMPLWHEVYSQAFPNPAYPMHEVTDYHPLLGWNRLKGCRAGVEYDFRDAGDPVAWMEVVREWGRWSQVNYEEFNGVGLDRHLRALRVCYAFGARFYTFYNWQRVDETEHRWVEYVSEFCKDEPKTLVHEASVKSSNEFPVSIPTTWATVNEISLIVDAPGEYTITVYDSAKKERVLGFRRKTATAMGVLSFDLPNCIPTRFYQEPYFTIAKDQGEFSLPLVSTVSLYSDSRRERMQSLLICWRADAQALISELEKRRLPGLEMAERLYRDGDYRRAYEAAVKIETSQ